MHALVPRCARLQEIDDPTDKKPSDWVDLAEIPDATAVKPDDWDEDAPKFILDTDAVKPEVGACVPVCPVLPRPGSLCVNPSRWCVQGWLDDEPEMVADPSVEMPEDWDEEEDGSWEAPLV